MYNNHSEKETKRRIPGLTTHKVKSEPIVSFNYASHSPASTKPTSIPEMLGMEALDLMYSQLDHPKQSEK